MSDEVRTSGPEAIRECEGAALGVLIWLPPYAGPRLAQLKGYVFTQARHKVIFDGIEALGRTGKVPDLASLIEYLSENGTIESAGGASYLHQIVDMACTNGAYRFGEYVRVIRGNEECGRKDEEGQAAGGMTNGQCQMALEKSPQSREEGGERPNSRVSDEDRGRGRGTSTITIEESEDGGRVEFPEVRAWEEPVDGAALLNELRALVLSYVVLPPGAAEILALWILHSYAYRLRRVTTYLGIVSAKKRSGKTTLLTVLGALGCRTLLAANVSPPSIFHAIEEVEPTLLIDEGDTFLEGKPQLRGILNAGYTRESAFVLRVEKQKSPQRHGVSESGLRKGESSLRKFSCWCPKAIASIGNLPETLADRCIVIVMKRKGATEKRKRFRGLRETSLQRKCVRFVADHAAEIAAAEPVMPEELNDRAADIREPLFVLAEVAGGEWPELVRKATLTQRDAGDELDLNALLVSDLEKTFQMGAERRLSRELVEALVRIEDRPWSRARRGGPIDELWLAKELRVYGIGPRLIRTADGVGRGYERGDFSDVFGHYAA
jgi:hypothetical protein